MFGHYFVYLMGSANGRAVYAGMTNDLIRRVREHKSGEIPGFTKRYRCHMLLYYEEYPNVRDAIARFAQSGAAGLGERVVRIDSSSPAASQNDISVCHSERSEESVGR